MTATSSKHTAGPAFASETYPEGDWVVHVRGIPQQLAYLASSSQVEWPLEANATLIAEAFTVATETGLTPRQLAERCKELEDFARNVAGLDDRAFTRADLDYFRSLIREYRDSARAALSKAQKGGV